jgi:hypothetical protein
MEQQIHLALSQSAHRVLSRLASFLPGLLALLIAIIVLAALGLLFAWVARRILSVVHFDDRINRYASPQGTASSLSEWAPAHSPTLLVSRFIFWSFLVLGIIIGISAFDAAYSTSSDFSLFLLPYLTHLIGAVAILVVGSLLARFLARSVLISAVNAQLQYARFLSLGVKWLVLVLAGAMALDHLNIGGSIVALAFGILFGGIVLTLALAVGLGSRDLVSRSLEKTPDLTAPSRPVAADPQDTQKSSLRHF